MRITRTCRLKADPLIVRLLGDIADATEHLEHGRYDDALATLQAWAVGEPIPLPDFGDQLAPRRAWADLMATLPPQLLRPLYAFPLRHLAELIAQARHAGDDDRERDDVIDQWAADFGLRLDREVDDASTKPP